MPYITKGNASKIISRIDSRKLPQNFGSMRGNVYKKSIAFFSVLEQNNLLLRKEFFRKPSSFLEVYQKVEAREDTYTYTFEGGVPAYHDTLDCPRLNSHFDSYEIPLPIRDKGPEEVVRFRKFFAENKELLNKNQDAFYIKMTSVFLTDAQLKVVDYENSGVENVDLDSLSELESIINCLLHEVESTYWASTPNERVMMNQFRKMTFLAFPPYDQKPFTNNDTGFPDEEIRDFLKDFAYKYKLPIIKYLKHYYRVFFNPEMEFQGELLDVLGFRKCSSCYSSEI